MAVDITSVNNKDSYIDGYSGYVNNNYGSNTIITIYNYAGWQIQHSLLNFTLPMLSGTITDITLNMYSDTVRSYNDPAIYVNAHLNNSDWTEGTLTWNNAPTYNATVIGQTPFKQVAGWYVIPLMGSGALNPLSLNWGDSVNLRLKASVENSSYKAQATWYSKEYTTDPSKRPYLEITYDGAAPTHTSNLLMMGVG
jgi:hypothetical protein